MAGAHRRAGQTAQAPDRMNALTGERLNKALVIAWVGVIAALVVMAGIAFASPSGWDASAFAYVGKGILTGEVPYLDRWDNKGPVTYLIYALGLLAPGWWGMWLVDMAFLLGSAWLAFKIVQREFGTTAALFSVATFLIYVRLLGGGLTEHYALLFQLLALFLFMHIDRRTGLNVRGGAHIWKYIAIGVLGALSFLLRANLIGVWLAIGIYWIVRWRGSRSRIAWSAAGGLSVLVAVSLAFAALGAWEEFWDATVVFNFAQSGASLTDRVRAAMLLVWYLSPVVPLLGIGWCVGVWYHLTGKTRGKSFERIWPFVLILGPVEVALSMLSGYGYGHYYLALLPVGALYLGFLVWLISKEQLAPVLLAFMLLYATVNYHMDIYIQVADILGADAESMVRKRTNNATLTFHLPSISHNDMALRVAETIERRSTAEDTILVWGGETQIHLLTGRDSPTRFFYQYPLVRSSYFEQSQLDEFISDVTNGRPAVIIDVRNSWLPPLDEASRLEWQPQRRGMHDPTQFQQLFDFVEAEYDLIEEIEDWRVYARN